MNDDSEAPGSGEESLVEGLVAQGLELEGAARAAWIETLPPDQARAVGEQLERLAELGLSMTPVSPPESRLGPYQLEVRVGSGGMGEVWRAHHFESGDLVALKLLRADMVRLQGARQRFEREARAASGLDHRAIVRWLEMGDEDGQPWMALQWVEGASLDRLLDRLRDRDPATLTRHDLIDALIACVPPGVRVEADDLQGSSWPACLSLLLADVAEGLDHAHRRGVLHRDVKPSNVLVSITSDAILTDFGLALPREGSRMTRTGAWLGSLPYASPEQVEGHTDLDGRADVYSLGATLYECLTLRTPFLGGSEGRIRARILSGDLAPPSQHDPSLARAFELVCRKAMDPEPRRRYADAKAMADDLRRAARGQAVRARALPAVVRSVRWIRRHPRKASLGALLTTVLTTTLAWALYERGVSDRLRRMGDSELVDRLFREAKDLGPVHLARRPEIRAWLSRAEALLARRPLHEAALLRLRGQARPYDAPQEEQDHGSARRLLLGLRLEIEALTHYLTVRLDPNAPHLPLDPEATERLQERWIADLERSPADFAVELERAIRKARDAARVGGQERDLEQLDELERQATEQEACLLGRASWRFREDFDQWRHDELAQLIERMGELERMKVVVRDMLRRSEEIAVPGARHEEAWESAREQIAELPAYAGVELEALASLMPLGRDPRSGLLEFLVIGTGEAPAREPGTGIGAADGVVLVLLPGGEFLMGAADEGRDSLARNARPRHRVRLDAYYLAKHELTVGQARRMGLDGTVLQGTAGEDWAVRLDWETARTLLAAHGLDHPTEAQWEYAATCEGSGTATASTGRGPVGWDAPNPFGLHGTLGNVREWCLDWMVVRGYSSQAARPGDGLRWTGLAASGRVVRGDAQGDPPGAWVAVSRNTANPSIAPQTGVRPCLTPVR